jgi:3-oxoadipate enol-lactonase
MWAETKDALKEAGYHVTAPDLPGPEAEPSLAAWAERLLSVTDDPLVPVGVSMGGYLAFELWRRAPERIVALVLVDTRAGGESEESRKSRDENIRIVNEDGAPALWERLAGKLFSPETPPTVVAQARELALEQGSVRLAAALTAMRDRPASTELLAGIDVPVLVLVGEDDALTPPSEAEAMAQALPNARLSRIARAGHLAPLERPGAFAAELLPFLAELAT